MPNYELPQVQNPDILGAYLRGKAAPGAMQLQQQQVVAGQQEQQMRMLQLAMGQSRLNAANQFDASQQSAQPSGPMLASNGGPPMSPGSPAPGTDALSALASPDRLAGFAQLGVHNALLSGGDLVKPIQDALATRAAAVKDQQERAKFALQPAVDEIENVRTAANPEQLVMANPHYKQVWDQYAPQLGLNPNDPKAMTPDNVRAAATLAHNNIAGQSMGGIEPLPMPTTYTQGAGPGGSVLQTEHGGKDNGKMSELVGRTPASMIAMNAPPIAATDPRVKAWMDQIHSGNATMQNVPAPLKTSVAEAMSGEGKGQYSPLAGARLTLESSRITKPFTDMSAYKLTADGKPYLERIQAALATPGSVSDQDLLDSLTKLNTGGNAVTEAQVSLVTHGKSFSDMVNTFKNKFKNGGVLSNDQRQQVSTIANQIYANYQKGYQPIYEAAAAKLKAANIPEAFWTIPNLNAINGAGAGGGNAHPQDIQDILNKYPGKK